MAKQIKINVYRSGGEWFGARWIDDEYDGCDELPCDRDASDEQAAESARRMPLTVAGPRTIVRVEDI